jgi:hypothetical protein
LAEHTTPGGFGSACRQWRVPALGLVILLVYAIDHQQTRSLPLLGFYWVPVLLATSFASVRQVAALNLWALALAVAGGVHLGFAQRLPGESALRLLAVTVIGRAHHPGADPPGAAPARGQQPAHGHAAGHPRPAL